MRRGVKSLLEDNLLDVLLTFSFLSRVPVRVKELPDWRERVRRVPRYFSLVGYLPGVVYLIGAIGTVRYSPVIGLISLAIGFYLFDLFHFDGLLDTFDGFLNQSTPERRLEIMSKGNVGPFAVFYGTLFVIWVWELMKLTRPSFLLFASVLGRLTMNFVLIFSRPAKPSGLGAMLYPPDRVAPLSSLMLSLPLLALGRWEYALGLGASFCISLLVAKLAKRLIGGVTGDVLGGSCLIGQLAVATVLHLASKLLSL